MSSTVLLLGATGETGKELLTILAASSDISKVVTLGRRPVSLPEGEGASKVEQRIIDFDRIEEQAEAFTNIKKGYCCLGTTRGQAGKDGFIKVDYDYVFKSAQLLKSQGCEEFHLLTSRGSNPNSWLLYPETKGRVEEAVKNLMFDRLSIYRPGLLLCTREERRTGEGWAQWLARLVDRGFSWSVPASLVARAMLLNSLKSNLGVEVLEHADIVNLANSTSS